jgi:hypothetical protein
MTLKKEKNIYDDDPNQENTGKQAISHPNRSITLPVNKSSG